MKKSNERSARGSSAEKITQILYSLEKYIIEGSIQSGTEMPSEKELAKQLGVSRFILREALRVAQFQGLIEISRGSRTKVAEVSIKPAIDVLNILLRRSANVLLDLTEARQGLECSIVELAALRADSSLIEQMQNTISEIEKNKSDLDLCIQKDIEFHDLIVKASKNVVFEIMMAPLTELLRHSRRETMRTFGTESSMEDHRAILEAIFERDPEKAKEKMHEHLQKTRKQLLTIGLSEKRDNHPYSGEEKSSEEDEE